MSLFRTSRFWHAPARLGLIVLAGSLLVLLTPQLASAACTDYKNYWGCAVRVDHFSGSSLSTGTPGWGIYDSPTKAHPRSKYNVRVKNGEVQLVGTYNQSTKKIMGAGITDRLNLKYGRWEVRMRVDRGAGYSAASLLWPSSGKWPNDGEIDIYEVPKADRQKIFHVVHNGANNAQQSQGKTVDATQWHTYAMEWSPTAVKFYIDGALTFNMTNYSLVPKTSTMHITLQLDAQRLQDGCSGWYQCPNSTTPAEVIMHVDYVKVWKRPA